MAVQHLQHEPIAALEAIHPSPDGNGRAGYKRSLNILGQMQARLLDRRTLHRSGYAVRLRADRDPRLSVGPLAAAKPTRPYARAGARAEARPGRNKIVPHRKDLDVLCDAHERKSYGRHGEIAKPQQHAQTAT